MITTRRVEEQFRAWSTGQCKAYAAGARAGLRGAPITEGYEYEESDDDDLTLYYYRGYADAIGSEAESAEWYDEISNWRIEYRWWV